MSRGATARSAAVVVCAGLLAGALTCGAWAAESTQTTSPGKAMYLKYCSACHGESGKGDGVVSGFLQPKPTDLTQIAKKNKGEFPFMAVAQDIDGTTSVRAHGSPDMPVWGEIFHAETTDSISRHVEVRGRIMLITEYLQSIQAK
ncbi:MAG TPA: c-type cytochrome [Candidatus Margulisiibacteriota bacterium]|nr:c-type cytochrome [Candidatus Margulisiibacteriota bacterium]